MLPEIGCRKRASEDLWTDGTPMKKHSGLGDNDLLYLSPAEMPVV